jgi:cytochrome c oxidase cbb3-type subunit 1
LLPAATPEQIDASCRWPMLFLAAKSAGWLFFGSLFGLIASLKFHGPAFLADSAWLTYGRVYPAAMTMFVYGFALQAGLAVGLWILCRLCRAPLASPGAVVSGTALWNLAVFWGVIQILAGNSSGVEGAELTRETFALLVAAWIVIGAVGLLTFSRRAEGELYPSVWFIVAALFVFPWVASTACLLLHVAPVRGVMQPLVGWWFTANLNWLVLGFLALAAVFYFVPQLSGRALHSQHAVLFAFWLVLLFAPWIGVPASAPLPAWLPALSATMSVFLLLPAIAVAQTLWKTINGPVGGNPDGNKATLRFAVVGGFAFALVIVLQVAQSVGPGNALLRFTVFSLAQKQLLLFGAVGMPLIGALYVIVSRVTGRELRASFAFGVLFVAVLVWTVALGLGGIQQGKLLADPNGFTTSVAKYLMFFRISTLADLALVIASFAFCWTMSVPVRCAMTGCVRAAMADKPAATLAKEGARA